MVGFMVKWALAAIPAFLILGFIGAVVIAVLAAFGSVLGTRVRTGATEAPAGAVARSCEHERGNCADSRTRRS
jgi:hypothetical protein